MALDPASNAGLKQGAAKVWDLPIRVGHWLLVLLFAGAWWTADTGAMQWHRYIGYAITGLLVFRLYWGFFGSSNARFKAFISGPAVVFAYIRSLFSQVSKPPVAGHNPLGGLSTLMLLGLLFSQLGLGLFAVDTDGMEAGPLSFYVSFEAGRAAAIWHERVFDGLLIMVGLHISAVLFYWLVRGQNLIARMINGRDRQLSEDAQPWFAPWWCVVPGLVVAGFIVWYLQSLDIPL